MFGFQFYQKRGDVRRLLSNRANQTVLKQVRDGDRTTTRTAFCEVVWLIPCTDGGRPINLDESLPVVTKDISGLGLSLIHSEEIAAERVVVGLECDSGFRTILCRCEHATPLGFGFFQMGLCPEA